MPHFSQCIPTSNEVYAFGRQADTPSQPTDPAYVAYMLSLAAQPELNLLRPPPCVLYSACAGLCLFACKAIFQSKQEINYRLHWQRKRWAEKVWGTRGDAAENQLRKVKSVARAHSVSLWELEDTDEMGWPAGALQSKTMQAKKLRQNCCAALAQKKELRGTPEQKKANWKVQVEVSTKLFCKHAHTSKAACMQHSKVAKWSAA